MLAGIRYRSMFEVPVFFASQRRKMGEEGRRVARFNLPQQQALRFQLGEGGEGRLQAQVSIADSWCQVSYAGL
jgi:hypothetical protein